MRVAGFTVVLNSSLLVTPKGGAVDKRNAPAVYANDELSFNYVGPNLGSWTEYGEDISDQCFGSVLSKQKCARSGIEGWSGNPVQPSSCRCARNRDGRQMAKQPGTEWENWIELSVTRQ